MLNNVKVLIKKLQEKIIKLEFLSTINNMSNLKIHTALHNISKYNLLYK